VRSDVQLVPGPPLDPSHGAVAQLGERVLCKHEVVGSIPIGSTNTKVASSRMYQRNRQRTSKRVTQRVSLIIDIVKARLAGLHKPVDPYDTQD
jgi:hypothetical protein